MATDDIRLYALTMYIYICKGASSPSQELVFTLLKIDSLEVDLVEK